MKSPYEILGIPQGADDAALREAYRKLSRTYEGDARRMQELNDAYDAIVLSRGQTAGTYNNQGQQRAQHQESRWCGRQGENPVEFGDIRRRIQAGRYDDALTLLDGMPARSRTAEWYYLKGCAQRGRGWLEEAERNFAQAVRLMPSNSEYRAAWDQIRGNRNAAHNRSAGDDMCCKVCAGLWCLDCLCDCMR